MRFSLIVPCFNHLEVSQQFLRSLLAHGPLGADVELVLVDDASTDGTAQWMDSLQSPFVTVVRHAQNQGFAKAMNSGAQQAQGEFLVLLNNDLVLTPHWFEPFESHAKRWQSDWGILGNVQIRTTDNTIDHAGFEFTEQGQLRHRQWIPPNVSDQACPLLTGACIMLPRQDFVSYGGFDAAYINGGEDLELCLQALQQGRTNKVLFNSQVFHQVSVSRASVEREHRDIANLVRLYDRWLEVLARLYALQYPAHNAQDVMEAELSRLRTHLAAPKPLSD